MVYVAADNIITSLGFTSKENFDQFRNNNSGINLCTDTRLSHTPFYTSLIDSGKIEADFASACNKNPSDYTRIEKLFIISISKSLTQSGINYTNDRTLLILSTTKGNIELLDSTSAKDFPADRIHLWSIANLLQHHFGLYHSPIIVSNACISGLSACIMAQRMISSGLYDQIIVSGGDVLTRFVISGFQSFQAISPGPCKPFDADRQGINLGEGCGTIVFTKTPVSLNNKASFLIEAGANTNDANHISGPSRTGDGLYYAINRALTLSGVNKEEIGYISAHGTGTNYNDEMEAKAISWAGMKDIPVNSLKAYIGHTLGAAGIIESIIGMQSIKNNLLIKSLGVETLGVSEQINILQSNHETKSNAFLKIASGFGGCNAAAIFKMVK